MAITTSNHSGATLVGDCGPAIITNSDDPANNFAPGPIMVITEGTFAFVFPSGNVLQSPVLPVGYIFPGRVVRINSTGSTGTGWSVY